MNCTTFADTSFFGLPIYSFTHQVQWIDIYIYEKKIKESIHSPPKMLINYEFRRGMVSLSFPVALP